MGMGAEPKFEALEDDEDYEDEQEPISGNDLNSMESQLKSLLGFQPR